MGACEGFKRTEFGGATARDQNLQAEILQKVEEFQPIYLSNYRYWWKMVCDFWTLYQSTFFDYVRSHQLKHFFFFFLLFSFSSHAIYFQTTTRTMFKLWAIEDIRKD